MFETFPEKTSMFFKRTCYKCQARKKVAYFDHQMITFDRNKKRFYCDSCGENVVNRLKLEEELISKQRAEKERLNYLMKEIKRKEIEQRAKELGID